MRFEELPQGGVAHNLAIALSSALIRFRTESNYRQQTAIAPGMRVLAG
jgi:hypothetical protein